MSETKGDDMLKDVELRLISELMKNSRRSDRQLAKALGVSQPTVSRLISKLQKEGVIKEYTAVPDFCKLGFNLMAIIMFKLRPSSSAEIKELHGAARELETQRRHPYLLVMDGIGLGKELVAISFHRDYGDYADYIRAVRESPNFRKAYVNTKDIEGFLIDLNYKDHYQPITFSRLAAHLQLKENEKNQ